MIDSAALHYLGKGGVNPWAARSNIICSLNLAANPKYAEQIIEAGWDLVIFDEAHRVRRSLQGKKVTATQAYKLADELKDVVNGLLLLTATPMQVHPFELYSLIELVEPGLFAAFKGYEQRRGMLPRLNALMKALKGWKALSPADQAKTTREQATLLRELGVDGTEGAALLSTDSERERIMDELVAMHPLAEALVRNRKAEIGGFTSREAHTVPVTLDDDELALYGEITEYIRNGYNRAQAERNLALGFLMVTYHKCWPVVRTRYARASAAVLRNCASNSTRPPTRSRVAVLTLKTCANSKRLQRLSRTSMTLRSTGPGCCWRSRSLRNS